MTRKLIENIFSLSLLQAVSFALPLFIVPYLAAILGPELVGNIAFSVAAIQIIVTLSDYGFNLTGPRSIAINRGSRSKVFEIWLSITIVRSLLSIIGLVIILIISLLSIKVEKNINLIIICYSMVVGNILYPQWLFQGLEKLKYITLIQVASRVLIFILVISLVQSSKDLLWAAFLQASGLLIGGLLTIPFLVFEFRGLRVRFPSVKDLIFMLKDGWHAFLSSAAINIYTTSNTFVLGFLVSSESLGYYSIAEKLIKAICLVYTPITTAIYPHVSRLAIRNKIELFRFDLKLLLYLTTSALIIGIILLEFSSPLINYFFDKRYIVLIPLLERFCFLPLLILISNVIGMLFMFPLGMEGVVSKILSITAFLNFIILILFVHIYGVIGAVSANLFIESFVVLMFTYASYKKFYLQYKHQIHC